MQKQSELQSSVYRPVASSDKTTRQSDTPHLLTPPTERDLRGREAGGRDGGIQMGQADESCGDEHEDTAALSGQRVETEGERLGAWRPSGGHATASGGPSCRIPGTRAGADSGTARRS